MWQGRKWTPKTLQVQKRIRKPYKNVSYDIAASTFPRHHTPKTSTFKDTNHQNSPPSRSWKDNLQRSILSDVLLSSRLTWCKLTHMGSIGQSWVASPLGIDSSSCNPAGELAALTTLFYNFVQVGGMHSSAPGDPQLLWMQMSPSVSGQLHLEGFWRCLGSSESILWWWIL